MRSYLIFMAVRLLEMHRILKSTGSIYLHCDPTASHYLKLLMDGIFGQRGFRNEIVWCYRKWSVSADQFVRNHDTILFYAGERHTFNPQFVDPSPGTMKRWKGKRQQAVFVDGARQATSSTEKARSPCPDWWDISVLNPNAKERTGYPTQKPLGLAGAHHTRQQTPPPADMVLDPFCGCATALVAADRLQREWAGVDLSPLAIKLVDDRVAEDRGLWGGATALTEPPKRTDLGDLPNYRTHRHRLYGEQEGVCIGCETHFPFRVMDVDHILPRSKGGTDHPDNLQLLCSGCNRSKGGRTMAEWRAAT